MAETETRTARAQEIEVSEGTNALQTVHSVHTPAITPSFAGMAHDPNSLAVIDREYQGELARQLAAIALTDPPDWVAFTDGDGAPTFRARASGMWKARRLFPFTVRPLSGGTLEPQECMIPLPDGREKKGLRCVGWAESERAGYGFEVEVTKLEGEDWTGRRVDAEGNITTKRDEGTMSHQGDQRLSARTALELKAFIRFSGLDRIPGEKLDAVWSRLSPPKSLEGAGRGAGYGSAGSRKAAKVQAPDVAAEAQKIWGDILRRVAGDEQKAAQVLFDITVSVKEPPKYGIRSPLEFFKMDQFKFAWSRLQKHPEYGDQAGGGA